MPIRVSCSNCKATLNAPDATAGKKVKCPKCGATAQVPIPVANAGPGPTPVPVSGNSNGQSPPGSATPEQPVSDAGSAAACFETRVAGTFAGLGSVDQEGQASAQVAQTVGTRIQQDGDAQRAVEQSRKPPSMSPVVPGYEILGELGRGGMGVVYKARQMGLNRIVAIKMIRAGAIDDREHHVRFRAEAEAAAGLQHVNIVQIYEIGEAQGQPFFSLEFVEGGSLRDKVRGTALVAGEAAPLVEKLARAVDVAHQHQIVHRDLKPGNVLLTASGEPKITDFGLAKRIDLDSGQTRSGAVLGTPSYMAPEQASGKTAAVGPLADVYALGAILYELLTGRPPFKGTTVVDTLDQVREQDPVAPRRLAAKVPRDLETICLKCLNKDPQQRYASAAALAEDLGRFLANEPILARPISTAQRIWKWTRRRPAVAALSVLMVLVSLAAFLGILVSWREAVKQQQQAEISLKNERAFRAAAERSEKDAKEAADLAKVNAGKELAARKVAEREAAMRERVAEFLAGLFKASDPLGLNGYGLRGSNETTQKLTAKQLLDRGAKQILERPDVDDLTRATLLDTIGNVYRSMGVFDQSKKMLEEALAVRKKRLPPDHPDLATSLHNLGWWHFDRGNLRQAEKLYNQALDIRIKAFGEEGNEVVLTKLKLGWLLGIKGDFDKAEKLLRQVLTVGQAKLDEANREEDLAIRTARVDEASRQVAIAQFSVAAIALDRGEPTLETYFLVQSALKTLARLEGDSSLITAVGHFQNGVIAQYKNEVPEAVAHFQKALDALIPYLTRDHAYVATVQFELGASLATLGKTAEAEKAYRASIDAIRKTAGLTHPKALLPVRALADLLAHTEPKRVAEGEALLKEVVDLRRESVNGNEIAMAEALEAYGMFLVFNGQHQRAVPLLQEAVDIFKVNEVFRRDPYYRALIALSFDLIAKGQNGQAESLLRSALELEKKGVKDENFKIELRLQLARSLAGQGKRQDAVNEIREGLKLRKAGWREFEAQLLQISNQQAAANELKAAEETSRLALESTRQQPGLPPMAVAPYLQNHAAVLTVAGKTNDALPVVRELVALHAGQPSPDKQAQALAQRHLLLLLLAANQPADARQVSQAMVGLVGPDAKNPALREIIAAYAAAPAGDEGKVTASAKDWLAAQPTSAAVADLAGLVYARAGHAANAIEALSADQAKMADADPLRHAACLAFAYRAANQGKESAKWLAVAKGLLQRPAPFSNAPFARQVVDRLQWQLLVREMQTGQDQTKSE